MKLVHEYIISLVNLYGIVHKDKVVEIYNEQNSEAINITVMDKVMREDVELLEKNYAFIERSHFVHESIIFFDDINEVLAERVGKPFYIPRKKELLKYRDQFYFEKTTYFYKLLRFITKNLTSGDGKIAVEICEEIQDMIQQECSLQEIFNIFNQMDIVFEGQEQVEEMLSLVTDLSNNTRLWANNGHTPKELFRVERNFLRKNNSKAILWDDRLQKHSKVGRNDSCPCGSGKKYKRCCLT